MARKKTRRAPKPAEQPAPADGPCTIVGVGASAGGLEAFTQLLQNLPEHPGFSLMLIQHQDPRQSSMLAELLARTTRIPVVSLKKSTVPQPDLVYVLPPNSDVTLEDGTLQLRKRTAGGPFMPIDVFFRSLAQQQGNRAIGVVLSGTASDGTLGLKAIKAEGGITFAQDVHSAKFDGMPRSAVSAGCVDFMLPPAELAAELVRLCRHPYVNGDEQVADESGSDDQAFTEVFGVLRVATGVDFNYYKPGTIRRRVQRRMALLRIESVSEYARYLREHRAETQLLFQDLLINVTAFFREPASFDAIRTKLLPALMKDRPADEPLRIWVPGCATGEEVYSIAICVLEHMRSTGTEIALQIFGTDLSEPALERARAGVYPESIAADVSGDRLRRFFVRANNNYVISRTVRDACVFARQNVTRDPPFSKLDLIVCRNLLIYLGPAIQMTVMRLFHYALKPSGYLVLGLSESVGVAGELFAPMDRKLKVYARKPAVASVARDFGPYDAGPPVVVKARPERESVEGQRRADQLLLARHAPPSVVVDRELRILQFRGPVSNILEHTPGTANLDLARMVPTRLAQEIRKLVDRAEQKKGAVRQSPVAIATKKRVQDVALSVTPLHAGEDETQFLLVFEPVVPSTTPPKLKRGQSKDPREHRIRELEAELTSTREYLQAVIEEQEASNEELKSAHEEVQSGNEELQSTNEELLTAKEELQSTNEELTTVNEEMQTRNTELQLLNNDLLNLLSSVNIPIVMLGNDLRVRRFTPQAEKLLNLLATDLGRPISDFRLKINLPDLPQLCQRVADELTAVEREVQDADGRTYSIWIRPYRTAENRIDGVVLAMLDVTDRKAGAEARYRRLFEAASDGIAIADAQTSEILDVNPHLARLVGYPRAELLGKRLWDGPLFRETGLEAATAEPQPLNEPRQLAVVLTTSTGQRVEADVAWNRYVEGERRVLQFNVRDRSARQGGEKARRELGRVASGVAHDFNNLLTAILGYCSLLAEDVPGVPPEGHQLVGEVRAAAERATLLTQQLLAFGRKRPAEPQELAVDAVLSDLQQLLRASLPENLRLELTLGATDVCVRADRGQLEQSVLNLVLNARDVMPSGGEIRVKTEVTEVDEAFARRHPALTPGQYVVLQVRDPGSGIDTETLAAAAAMTQHSGGHVLAYSEFGVGTTFALYLPALHDGQAAAAAPAVPQEPRGGDETVLLVEDEAALRALTRRFLEQRGYTVLEASDGPDALRVSRSHAAPIHLLVTDVVMPVMSGREVAFQLAGDRPEMRVLYMSGHADETIIHHGILAQGVSFMPKPFVRPTLLAKVRDVLDAPRSTSKDDETSK